jgi:hypothetical protein
MRCARGQAALPSPARGPRAAGAAVASATSPGTATVAGLISPGVAAAAATVARVGGEAEAAEARETGVVEMQAIDCGKRGARKRGAAAAVSEHAYLITCSGCCRPG